MTAISMAVLRDAVVQRTAVHCGILLIYMVFYHVIPNALSETNQFWTVSRRSTYRRSDAGNLGSLCFIVHEKIDLQTDSQTDGHGENISVFFPRGKKR